MTSAQAQSLLAALHAIHQETEETNRLLTALLAQHVPVHPTPAELGLTEPKP